jgi:probable phosphoglycerate mutase
MVELYLIRHAECDINLAYNQTIGGRSHHSPLTDRGKLQAAFLRRRFCIENIVFDSVHSSPAIRAHHTAIIGTGTDKDIIISPSLQELSQGEWEGKDRAACYTADILQVICSDPLHFRAPGGESQYDVETRMHGYVNEQFDGLPTEHTAALYTHGMAIKCFLRGVLSSSPHMTRMIDINNTAITHVTYHSKQWHIVTINDTAHLKNY